MNSFIDILAEKNVDIHLLTEQLNLFKALLHARRSKKKLAGKIDQRQMSLFDEAEATPPENFEEISEEANTEKTPDDEKDFTVIPEHKRAKKRRRTFPDDIPHEDVIFNIVEEDKACPCGCHLKKYLDGSSRKVGHRAPDHQHCSYYSSQIFLP